MDYNDMITDFKVLTNQGNSEDYEILLSSFVDKWEYAIPKADECPSHQLLLLLSFINDIDRGLYRDNSSFHNMKKCAYNGLYKYFNQSKTA